MALFHPVSNTDFISKDRLREVQWQRFERILRHAHDNVSWYREKMKAHGVKLEDIRSLSDIHKLPFIVKTDLRDTYPFGMFAVPMSEVVRVHASSGTTGKPIVVAYTQSDLDVWKNVVSRALAAFGVDEGDVLQNSFGYGLFTGGLGIHFGAEHHGMTVIPMSGGNTERQIMLMRDFNVSVISCTPSYFVHLLEKSREMGVDLASSSLRVGIFGAEPWTEEMRIKIEQEAHIKAYDIYGLTEVVGPGVGAECREQAGPHIFEDYFYPEIIDPDTLEPLPDGEEGELVFTTLSKWAMPLIRYRTRDITHIINEPCPCGRTLRRIARISHRSDDMFIVRGVNVFPGQIEAALLAVEGTLPHYQIVLTRGANGLDDVEVQVRLTPEKFDDTIKSVGIFQKEIADKIQHTIGIRVRVKFVSPSELKGSEGKAKRVLDLRNIK